MRSNPVSFAGRYAGVAFCSALLGWGWPTAAPAGQLVSNFSIINIDATSSTGTSVTLGPGTYQLSWAGTAGGGQYDAWTYNWGNGGNYRDAFTLSADGSTTTYDRNDGNLAFNNYANAAAAIADFTGNISDVSYQLYAGTSDKATALGVVQGPIVFNTAKTTTYTFSVPDYLLIDNGGGVSLRLQPLPSSEGSVPTPGSLVLVVTALGAAAGVVHHRRRRAAKAGVPAEVEPPHADRPGAP